MLRSERKLSELVSLAEAAAFLRSQGRPRHPQSLRERIKRNSLRGVRIGRNWFVLRKDIEFLAQQPYHRAGGHPTIHRRPPRVDPEQVEFIAKIPLPARAQAMYAAQTMLLAGVRARVRRAEPDLKGIALAQRVFEELEKS